MIKRFLKWVLMTVLFRKVLVLLRMIVHRLGNKSIFVMGTIFIMLTIILKHCA